MGRESERDEWSASELRELEALNDLNASELREFDALNLINFR
jgi:hypothetical protein